MRMMQINSETPRQKQQRFRAAVKEYLAWTLMLSVPFLMIANWIIAGY